jgi:hypothetical protein
MPSGSEPGSAPESVSAFFFEPETDLDPDSGRLGILRR